jgi:hypothetical protein
LDFARKTINQPVNVYPEWWYYQERTEKNDYWMRFWKKYGNVWQAWKNNPAGDYTVDSGNSEQSAVFLGHFYEELLGLKAITKKIHLWPKMPFEFKRLSVKNAKFNCTVRIDYEFIRENGKMDLRLDQEGAVAPCRLTLALPESFSGIIVKENEVVTTEFELFKKNDVRWLSFISSAKKINHFEIHCDEASKSL